MALSELRPSSTRPLSKNAFPASGPAMISSRAIGVSAFPCLRGFNACASVQGYTIVRSEEDFQCGIDLVVIPEEARYCIPRATQEIPAKLYIDVWPVLDDDIGIVIITGSRDIVKNPQRHLEIIGKQFL